MTGDDFHLDGSDVALQHTEVVIGLSIIGRSSNSCLEHLQRILCTALSCEDDGQVVETLREVGAQLQCCLVTVEGSCMAVLLS
jgi:hypothetical protein